MKVIKVLLKYKENDTEVVKKFDSLLQCAREYNTSVSTLKNIISGKATRMRKLFPADCVFELKECDKVKADKWHCDVCNIDLNYTSKSMHIFSEKHKIHYEYQNK